MTPLVLAGKAAISLLVTGGQDGILMIWRDFQHMPFTTHCQSAIETLDLLSAITKLQVLYGQPVFLVGTADGMVRFIHIAKKKDGADVLEGSIGVILTILKEERLCTNPVSMIEYNAGTQKIAAGCYHSKKAFIICAAPNNLHVIGVTETEDDKPLAVIKWCIKNPMHLIIGSVEGTISCIDTLSMCFSPEPIDPIWTKRFVGIGGLYDIILNPVNSLNKIVSFFALSNGQRGVNSFIFELGDNEGKSTPGNYCQSSIFGMETHGTCAVSRIDKHLFFCGSSSGEIVLYHLNVDGSLEIKYSKRLHSSAVICLSFSADGRRLFSAAIDGSFLVHQIEGITDAKMTLSSHEYDYLVGSESNPILFLYILVYVPHYISNFKISQII